MDVYSPDIVVWDPNTKTKLGINDKHHMNMDHSAWEGFEIDGVQYIGIPTGRGGGSPWRIGNFLTPGLVSPSGHNALYVFKLGGS